MLLLFFFAAAVSKVGGLRMQDNALPFLERPPALDGSLAGDVGFDPVGFSNYFDLKWLREAELKHGRVCMLAFTGMIAQEAVCLPQFQNGATPLDDFFEGDAAPAAARRLATTALPSAAASSPGGIGVAKIRRCDAGNAASTIPTGPTTVSDSTCRFRSRCFGFSASGL